MKGYIELTNVYGQKFCTMVEDVRSFGPNSDGECWVKFPDGEVNVKESYETVKALLFATGVYIGVSS